MRKEINIQNITDLARKVKVRDLGIILSTSAILILSIAIVSLAGNVKTIIMPPVINKTFWVEDATASDTYIRDMTEFFVQLALNVSPGSVNDKKDMFLRYVHSGSKGNLQAKMGVEADRIIRFNASQVFYPEGGVFISSKDSLSAGVNGKLITMIGNTSNLPVPKTYRFKYKIDAGQIRVIEFTEASQNDPFNPKTDPVNHGNAVVDAAG